MPLQTSSQVSSLVGSPLGGGGMSAGGFDHAEAVSGPSSTSDVQSPVQPFIISEHYRDAPVLGIGRLRVIAVLDQLEQEAAAILPHGLLDHALLALREVLVLPRRDVRPDQAPCPVPQEGISLRTRSRLDGSPLGQHLSHFAVCPQSPSARWRASGQEWHPLPTRS